MNVSDYTPEYEKLADLFSLLAQPSRLLILQLMGNQEICVCHLMASLGYRQAYISQQLMGLRKAGYVKTRRQGRSIYYSLADPRLLGLIDDAALHLGLNLNTPTAEDLPGCPILPDASNP